MICLKIMSITDSRGMMSAKLSQKSGLIHFLYSIRDVESTFCSTSLFELPAFATTGALRALGLRVEALKAAGVHLWLWAIDEFMLFELSEMR